MQHSDITLSLDLEGRWKASETTIRVPCILLPFTGKSVRQDLLCAAAAMTERAVREPEIYGSSLIQLSNWLTVFFDTDIKEFELLRCNVLSQPWNIREHYHASPPLAPKRKRCL